MFLEKSKKYNYTLLNYLNSFYYIKRKEKLLRRYLIPILLLSFTLISCNTKSDIISNNSNSNQNSPVTENIIWNKEVDEQLKDVLGDHYTKLVKFDADKYKSEKKSQQGLSYVDLKCYGKNEHQMEESYALALKLNGFKITRNEANSLYEANLRVSEYQILIANIKGISYGGEEYLNIITYIVQDKLLSWPEEQVKSVLNEDIPHAIAPYYQYQIQEIGTIKYIAISCFGIDSHYLNDYGKILNDANYVSSSKGTSYSAVNEKKKIEIDYYFDIDNNYFYLQTYKI